MPTNERDAVETRARARAFTWGLVIFVAVVLGIGTFGFDHFSTRPKFAAAWQRLQDLRDQERSTKRPLDIQQLIGQPPVESYSPRDDVFVERYSWRSIPFWSYDIYVIYKRGQGAQRELKNLYKEIANRKPDINDLPQAVQLSREGSGGEGSGARE